MLMRPVRFVNTLFFALLAPSQFKQTLFLNNEQDPTDNFKTPIIKLQNDELALAILNHIGTDRFG